MIFILIFKLMLNLVLCSFWMMQVCNKVFYGGWLLLKLWDVVGIVIFLLNKYSLCFCCVCQIQNKIEELVYILFKIQIDCFGLWYCFCILNNKIINWVIGFEFVFYGFWCNIEEIKFLEGISVLWFEEVYVLMEYQWKILEFIICKEGLECWFIFNFGLVIDFVWCNFVVDLLEDMLICKINYDENFFLFDMMLKVIEVVKCWDLDGFKYVYEGVLELDDDVVIIKLLWIEVVVDVYKILNFELSGCKCIGFDVVDSGVDKCVNVYCYGFVVYWVDEWKVKEDELLKSCQCMYQVVLECDVDIVYDLIGVGVFVGVKFLEINEDCKCENMNVFCINYQ